MLKFQKTKTSIEIIDTKSQSVIKIEKTKEGVERVSSNLDGKNKQYGSYTEMFLQKLLTVHLPKKLSYDGRINIIMKKITELKLENCPTIRNFSSRIRKAFDDGVYYPQGTYFYEKCK